MKVDHGLDKPKAKRKRPAPTHRDVSHLPYEERASAPQNAPGTVPHGIALGERPYRSEPA